MWVGPYHALKEAGYDVEKIFGADQEKTLARREGIAEFTQGLGFVVYFIFLSLFLYIVAGEKLLRYFLYIVLLGMVLLNTDKFSDLLRRVKP